MGPDGQMIAIEKPPFSWKQFGFALIPSVLLLLPLLLLILTLYQVGEIYEEIYEEFFFVMCWITPILSLIFIIVGFSTGRTGLGVGGITALVLYPAIGIMGVIITW